MSMDRMIDVRTGGEKNEAPFPYNSSCLFNIKAPNGGRWGQMTKSRGEGRMKDILKLISLMLLAGILLCLTSVARSDQSANEDKTKNFSLADYLCVLAPTQCHGDLYKKVYLAPRDAVYKITLNGKHLQVPMGYLNVAQLWNDPSRPIKKELLMEALLPDLAPHDLQNLREFFIPYARSKISILIGIRLPGAMNWNDAINFSAKTGMSGAISLIRRPDKFGLEGWGEDYARWPSHRPCSNQGKDEPTCGDFPMSSGDVWRPIKPNGTNSIIICDPDILDDLDAKVLAMPVAARESYFADPSQWGGHRRVFCRHTMLYKPLNAEVSLEYPRRFIEQWKDIEDRVRTLLDTFIRNEQGSASH